ncbi:UNKNOWN [Stylonychia lemnae]|uniref:Uncharacterized protein n=1 Tax=Stylonychia lemnae TaxID=5949 RepID=A0A077ZW58_STYLE|nr:UNKNOWN [Stylonychia lemnae]|eukprot:CDW74104.1 UNKNOWN [Stylonychia lemnae]
MKTSQYLFITAILVILLESSQAVKTNAQKTKLSQSLSFIKTKLASRNQDNSTNSTDSNGDSESNSTNSNDDLPVSCPNGPYNLDEYDQEIFDNLVDDAWQVVLDYGLYTYDQEDTFREEAVDSLQEICYYVQFETFVNETREALNYLRQANQTLVQWTPSAEDLKQVDKLVAQYLVELLLVKEKEIRTLAESLTNSSRNENEFNSSVSYLETQVKNKIDELNGYYSGSQYKAQTKNTIKRAQVKNFWDNVVAKE